MLLASVTSIPTISGAIEEEYANSEASYCDGYITDHTDLASDFDESEYRRQLLKDVSLLIFIIFTELENLNQVYPNWWLVLN